MPAALGRAGALENGIGKLSKFGEPSVFFRRPTLDIGEITASHIAHN
jgi:hypothetical protein